MRLILASASPRRAELLRGAGYSFETIVTDIDERARPDESPTDYVRRLASEKSAAALAVVGRAEAGHDRANSVASGFSWTERVIVLGADTSVVVEGEVLGKPRDDREAAVMLRRLSGRDHEVMTGISVRSLACEAGAVDSTTVSFAPLSQAEIEWYVACGEGRDKAGAYAIQGLASRFIPKIVGSYSNVVGLPMATVAALLAEIRQVHR